jgi:transcriptional regulator with XRE-family HTH domain
MVSNQNLLFEFGMFSYRKQPLFTTMVYFDTMSKAEAVSTHLTHLREMAGLTVRELARQIGTNHPNILYWEKTGRVVKTEFLLPMAKALGVTVEEVLGEERARKTIIAGGKMGQLFEQASKLPRSQQQKIADVIEGVLLLHESKSQ